MERELLNQTYWQRVSEELYDMLITKGIEIATALLILIVGIYLIRKLAKGVNFFIVKRTGDIATGQFIGQTVRITLLIMLFLSVAAQMGIQTTSFVAAIGAAGLTIGLALQGSLSNFAGGILILIFKPFKVGDYIESMGFYGEVVGIDILHTKLITVENKYAVLPNGQVANSSVVNSSRKKTRRSEFIVLISYRENISKVRELILSHLKKDDRVHSSPKPEVTVLKLGESNIQLAVRFWTDNGNHTQTSSEIQEQLLPYFTHEGKAVRLEE